MTKAEQIRAIISKLIDIEGSIYDMTCEDYNTVPELREALMQIREVGHKLMTASCKESCIEEKQEHTAKIAPSVKHKHR